jgi:hypothetical protein
MQGREAGSSGGNGTGGSRWWYGVALVPAIVPVTVVVVLLVKLTSSSLVAALGAVSIASLWVAHVALGLFVPGFLYLDAGSLESTDWSPNAFVFFTVGVVGVLVPPLLLGVTVRYLYLRHDHVGLA